jgi:hypothetical protein
MDSTKSIGLLHPQLLSGRVGGGFGVVNLGLLACNYPMIVKNEITILENLRYVPFATSAAVGKSFG